MYAGSVDASAVDVVRSLAKVCPQQLLVWAQTSCLSLEPETVSRSLVAPRQWLVFGGLRQWLVFGGPKAVVSLWWPRGSGWSLVALGQWLYLHVLQQICFGPTSRSCIDRAAPEPLVPVQESHDNNGGGDGGDKEDRPLRIFGSQQASCIPHYLDRHRRRYAERVVWMCHCSLEPPQRELCNGVWLMPNAFLYACLHVCLLPPPPLSGPQIPPKSQHDFYACLRGTDSWEWAGMHGVVCALTRAPHTTRPCTHTDRPTCTARIHETFRCHRIFVILPYHLF